MRQPLPDCLSCVLLVDCLMCCWLHLLPLQEAAEADDPDSYTPFQFMLQFMLQPLLVASGSTPAGHMAPALLKMCRALKHTADTAVSSGRVWGRGCVH